MNGFEVFFIVIIIWLIIAVGTYFTGLKTSQRLEESNTAAIDSSIAIGIVLIVGILVTGLLWLVFGTIIVPVPDMTTTIIYQCGSVLTILVSIVYVFYPKLKKIRTT